jgi:2-oxoglutarate ferredoxin oxidoreductase subunit beta
MGSIIRGINNLGINKNNVVAVSGIGCSSRICGYLDFHTLHTTHGRAIAFATGIKLSRPELTLIVPMGDGDALAIGGNHLIHAARRNIAITAIIMNNNIYGMTGGQPSPTTPFNSFAAANTPYGNIDQAFDIAKLAIGAGASFVARTTTYHVIEMVEILEKAISHKGFSVVEILSQCPTYFGRKNKLLSAVDMLNYYKENTILVGSEEKTKRNLIERGIFLDKEIPEYCSEYQKLVKKTFNGKKK